MCARCWFAFRYINSEFLLVQLFFCSHLHMSLLFSFSLCSCWCGFFRAVCVVLPISFCAQCFTVWWAELCANELQQFITLTLSVCLSLRIAFRLKWGHTHDLLVVSPPRISFSLMPRMQGTTGLFHFFFRCVQHNKSQEAKRRRRETVANAVWQLT